jgi:glycosyltransferase involved in cell wall biosynthesis/GT2 family glycosyltransferase
MAVGTGVSPKGEGVDVVVPVFGAADHLERCLTSLARNTSFPPHNLILVVDGPQGAEVEAVVSRHYEAENDWSLLLRNSRRMGYVASANRGLAESSRDVVLLNSDTEVTNGWLEKLQSAAYSSSGIATVTPLSNTATICSVPEFLEDNILPAGTTVDEMGEIVASVSERHRPRLPTGVGFCLYIRRAALDAVGDFDESAFGLGYGEENEFCIRTSKAGYEHVADDATFVYHAGQKSFGPAKMSHLKCAARVLHSIDRRYESRVASFIRTDQLRPVRDRIVDTVVARHGPPPIALDGKPLSVLHIVHGWPPFDIGGTEQYARQLAIHQAGHHRVSAFSRLADRDRATGQRLAYLDRNVRVRLVVNNFDQRNPWARNAVRNATMEGELAEFVDHVKPDLTHVHHLSGHSASLMKVLQRRRIPTIYQIQDWWPLCARSNMWHPEGRLCQGPTPARCAKCLPMTGIGPSGPLNRWLHRTRRRHMKSQISRAHAYIMGSKTIHRHFADATLLGPEARVHVLDYGVEMSEDRIQLGKRRNGPTVFGFIGVLMPHKGAHVAVEAFRGINPDEARLLVWGNPEAQPDYTARVHSLAELGPVELRGSFNDDEKSEIFGSIDVLIIPSLGLESFGIVAREAMSKGVPIIATKRGAFEELEIDGVCGALVPPEDSSAIRKWIDRLIENPGTIDTWRRSLPKPTSILDHVTAIDRVYRQVVGDSD